MIVADFHVHSTFSVDGMSTMEQHCIMAMQKGIKKICFTEHVDYNIAEYNVGKVKDNRKQNFNINEYFNEIERLNTLYYPSIEILSGIEFSEPHLFKDEFEYYSSLPFDYRDILPDNLLSTRKIPFLSPVRFWIENIFMEDIIRVFRDKNLIESLGMNSCTVSRIIDDYRGKYEDVSNVWGVYVFLKWFEIHNA